MIPRPLLIAPNTLQLHRSELLALGAALEFECRGIDLGWGSARRILNHAARRHWRADQWLAALQEPYEAITGPLSIATLQP